MSKCTDCGKLHILKRDLCDACYIKGLQSRIEELEAWPDKLAEAGLINIGETPAEGVKSIKLVVDPYYRRKYEALVGRLMERLIDHPELRALLEKEKGDE